MSTSCFLLLVISTAAVLMLLSADTQAYSIPHSQQGTLTKRSAEVYRSKRYTDFQERASSFCTGMCMYDQRQPYSDCFDACNWTGRGPSPWTKFGPGTRAGADSAASSSPADSVDNMAGLMRVGTKGG